MKKYIDIRVTALSETDLKDFLIMLRKIQWCGHVGTNRILPVVIDGDGSGQYDFNLIKEGQEIKNIIDIVNLDEEKLKNVSDGENFEPTYLGE